MGRWITRIVTPALRAAAAKAVVALIALGALSLTALRLGEAVARALAGGLTPQASYYALMSIASFLAAALALALLRIGWNSRSTATLSVFLSLYALGAAFEGSAGAVLQGLPLSDGSARRLKVVLFNALVALTALLWLRWLQQYPEKVTPDEIDAWSAPDAGGGPLRAVVARWLGWLLHPLRVWLAFGLGHFLLSSAGLVGLPVDATVVRVTVCLMAALTALGYVAVHRSRTADPERARRAAWIAEALTLGATLAGLALILETQLHVLRRTNLVIVWLHALVLPLSLMVFASSLAVSTFYRGAIDPALVVRRTTVLGALGLFLTALFIVGEELLSTAVVAWFGWPDLLGSVLAGLLTAAAFAPMHRWVDHVVGQTGNRTAP